jgi:hypothetical protein
MRTPFDSAVRVLHAYLLLLILSSAASAASAAGAAAAVAAEVFDPAAAGFTLHWANATIDHFNFVPKGPQFPLRVYVMDQHWDRETGPILFCERTQLECHCDSA